MELKQGQKVAVSWSPDHGWRWWPSLEKYTFDGNSVKSDGSAWKRRDLSEIWCSEAAREAVRAWAL